MCQIVSFVSLAKLDSLVFLALTNTDGRSTDSSSKADEYVGRARPPSDKSQTSIAPDDLTTKVVGTDPSGPVGPSRPTSGIDPAGSATLQPTPSPLWLLVFFSSQTSWPYSSVR